MHGEGDVKTWEGDMVLWEGWMERRSEKRVWKEGQGGTGGVKPFEPVDGCGKSLYCW